MLLNSVIIALREFLEAALLMGILAALSATLGISRRWMVPAMLIGLAGAAVYSYFLADISQWFDGVGQEIYSATLQVLVYCLFVAVALAVRSQLRGAVSRDHLIAFLSMLAVTLAITREGYEVLIYLHGFASHGSSFLHVVLGTAIGGGIGISGGILLYYGLRLPPLQRAPSVAIVLLGFFGAGLMLQSTQLLIQADWLPATLPLWDTEEWLSERSVTGQILYALVGYESTPEVLHLIIYLLSLFTMLVLALPVRRTAPGAGAEGEGP